MKPAKEPRPPEPGNAPAESYLDALIEILKAVGLEQARRAAQALGEAGESAAVKPLVAVVKGSAALRAAALAALRKIAQNDQAAAVELAAAVMGERGDEKPAETVAGTLVLADRRRSPRVFLAIPVLVRWVDKRGQPHAEATTTKIVNAYGALVVLRTPIELDQEVHITNTSTQAVAKARVVCLGAQSEHGNEVAIELGTTDPEFWVGRSA